MKVRVARRVRVRLGWSAVMVPCLVVVLGLLVAACGSSTPNATAATSSTLAAAATSTTAGTATTGGPTTTTAGTGTAAGATTTQSGTDLGKAVVSAWTKAIQALNTLLAGQPDAGTVKDKVAALKEQYVQQLVALGRQREKLDANGKGDTTAAVNAGLVAAANTDWYTTYKNLDQHYVQVSSNGDMTFANLLASFNTLIEYADFDRLRAQDADEARRLGVY